MPLVRSGRYRGGEGGSLTISGLTAEGEPWSRTVDAVVAHDRPEVAAIWARARLRDLEDRYAVNGGDELEREIVRTSLRHGVLCRFTAYVAIDTRVATDGTAPHEVTQPVELPSGWESQAYPISVAADMAFGAAAPSAPPSPGMAPMASRARQPHTMSPMLAKESKSAGPDFAAAEAKQKAVATLTMVREQAANEAQLLRASADESALRRRDLLDDLVTRLDALWLQVERSGKILERVATTALRELIALLREERRTVDERWDRALILLDELAGKPAERRTFWKRG